MEWISTIRRHECPLHHLQGLARIVFPPGDGAGEDGAAAQGLGQHLHCLALGREAAENRVLAVVRQDLRTLLAIVLLQLRNALNDGNQGQPPRTASGE